jgi:hypothetical protein
VPVKTPLLARRGLWVGVAVALVVILGIFLTAAFITQRNEDREAELTQRMADSVTGYRGQLEPILSAIGNPVTASGFATFPDLDAAIQQLESDSEETPADPQAAIATGDGTVEAATSALEALQAIDESALVQGKGFSEEFVLYLVNSKGNFVRAMRLYVQAAHLTKAAAQAEGAQRVALLARARGVTAVASELASRAYSDYVQAQVKADVFQPPDPLAGLPVPTGPSS